MEQDRNYGNNSGMQNKLRKYNVDTESPKKDYTKDVMQSDCITCGNTKAHTSQCKACSLHNKTTK
jgi:hypothetical protein